MELLLLLEPRRPPRPGELTIDWWIDPEVCKGGLDFEPEDEATSRSDAGAAADVDAPAEEGTSCCSSDVWGPGQDDDSSSLISCCCCCWCCCCNCCCCCWETMATSPSSSTLYTVSKISGLLRNPECRLSRRSFCRLLIRLSSLVLRPLSCLPLLPVVLVEVSPHVEPDIFEDDGCSIWVADFALTTSDTLRITRTPLPQSTSLASEATLTTSPPPAPPGMLLKLGTDRLTYKQIKPKNGLVYAYFYPYLGDVVLEHDGGVGVVEGVVVDDAHAATFSLANGLALTRRGLGARTVGRNGRGHLRGRVDGLSCSFSVTLEKLFNDPLLFKYHL